MARELPKDIFEIQVIIDTLKIVWEASRKHTIIRIALVILNAFLPLIPLYLFKLLLDSFSTGQPVVVQHVVWIIIAMASLALFSIVIKNISAYNSSIQSDIITDHMAALMIDKSLNIDLEFYDSDTYHDKFARAMGQGGTKPLAVLGGVTGFFQNGITLLAIIVLLFTLHWSITFILFIITMPVAYIRFIYSEKMIELGEAQTQPGRLAGYYKGVLTGGATASEVRMFSYGKHLLDKFLALASLLRKERRDLYLEQLKWVSVAQSAEIIAMLSALGFIVYKAIQGNMTVGDITLYYMAFQKGQGNVSGLMNSAIGLHKQKLTLNYLFEFLYTERKVADPVDPIDIPQKIESLEIKDLGFIYPGTTKEVLKNINFEAKKGEIIAIVGENGSGKTTLIKLINRLYDPTKGSVNYNNTNIKKFLVEDIRRKITVIFQGFATYALTVKDNITLSDVFQPPDFEKIQWAAELAEADKFIERLPKKYDAQLGRAFKDGHQLSKGQMQKLALSRAFYKDGDIVVLDEPTSYIDPISEDNIFKNFKAVSKNKILFLITHRVYNLTMADKILVLDQGELVEIGSHRELMVKGGLYCQMFESQEIEK